MKKKRFFRKQSVFIRNHRLLIFTSLFIFPFCLIALINFCTSQVFYGFQKYKINSPSISNKKIFYIEDSEYKNKVIEHVKALFDIIWENCRDSNEIQFNKKKTQYECVGSNNMKLLLLESLETLYISNEYDLYNKASEYIKNTISYENIEWIDIRDFWTRFIGSLIGIYQISDDKIFLDIAINASKHVLEISNKYKYPMSKVNIKTMEMKQYSYMNKGNIDLSDATCGLPEILELYKITGDIDYYLQYSKQISEIPTNISTPLSSFYHQSTRIETQKPIETTGSVNDFYSDIQIADELRDNKFISNFISSTINFTERSDTLSFIQWSLFVEKAKKRGLNINENKYKMVRDNALENIPPFIKKMYNYSWKAIKQIPCFKYEIDSLLFYRLYHENEGIILNAQDFIEKLIEPIQNGYDSSCLLLNGDPQRTGAITSNVLGQWLKEGLLFLTKSKTILNQNGHILEFLSFNPSHV